MDRNSSAVKFARLLQKTSPLASPIEWAIEQPLKLMRKEDESTNSHPFICILAPPRSGSTLTYQFLVAAVNGDYLTNVANVLYATPTLGHVASRLLRKTQNRHHFESTRGLVPGLTGEAEGLKFWYHWTGMSLDQEESHWKHDKSCFLAHKANLLTKKPFITKYLGHVFCVEELRTLFPNIIFVHVIRNLQANALSLYKASPDRWISTKPKDCKSDGTRFSQIADQIVTIHEIILKATRESDTLRVHYEFLCTSPKQFGEQLQDFCTERNQLLRVDPDNIPAHFDATGFSDEDLELQSKIAMALNDRIDHSSPLFQEIFSINQEINELDGRQT